MASEYPPRGDDEMIAAAEQFRDNAPADPTVIGLTSSDLTRLITAITTAKGALTTHKTSKTQARTDRLTKDDTLDDLEDILQEFNRNVQPHSTTTDAHRIALGLPVYDKIKTKAAAPTESPVVEIDGNQPLRHEIRFEGKTTKAKPDGVKALEIWLKLGGTATEDPKDYQFQAQDSDPPYLKVFNAADAGKQAHYLFAWVNASGERGPWLMKSVTISSQVQQDLQP